MKENMPLAPTHSGPLALSPLGSRHREQILARMHEAARTRSRRRRAATAIACALPLCAAAWIAFASSPPVSLPHQRNIATVPVPAPIPHHSPASPPGSLIQVLHTDPASTDRFVLADTPLAIGIEIIDDERLSQELARAGRPSGIVRTANHVVVLARRGVESAQ